MGRRLKTISATPISSSRAATAIPDRPTTALTRQHRSIPARQSLPRWFSKFRSNLPEHSLSYAVPRSSMSSGTTRNYITLKRISFRQADCMVQVPPEITSLSNMRDGGRHCAEFRYHPKLHHSQTRHISIGGLESSGTTRNYITLKPVDLSEDQGDSSGTTRNYITLKLALQTPLRASVQVPPEITSLSNVLDGVCLRGLFRYHPKLHHSQTHGKQKKAQRLFRYHPKLHHSQTQIKLTFQCQSSGTTRNYITLKPRGARAPALRVQVPPEITSLSNNASLYDLARWFRYHPKLHHSQTGIECLAEDARSGTTRNYITLKLE